MTQTATKLEFDRETHTYTLGDRVLPSVTQIIQAAGLVDSTWFTEVGRRTGEDVAYLTELEDRGEAGKVAAIIGERMDLGFYLNAWIKFKEESSFAIRTIEEQVCDYTTPTPYAGTLDRWGTLGGRSTILDIKRYAHAPWHGVQLAGYASTFPHKLVRAGVHLKPDGNYKLHRFEDDADYDAWHAIVRQWHGRDMPGDARAIRTWKSNHGVRT